MPLRAEAVEQDDRLRAGAAARSQVKTQPLSSAPAISSRPSGERVRAAACRRGSGPRRQPPDAASQSRTVRSSPPVMIVLPSAVKRRQRTGSAWASPVASRSRPVRTSQKCRAVGPPLAAIVDPSGENAQAVGVEVGHSKMATVCSVDTSWIITSGQCKPATSRPSAEKAASSPQRCPIFTAWPDPTSRHSMWYFSLMQTRSPSGEKVTLPPMRSGTTRSTAWLRGLRTSTRNSRSKSPSSRLRTAIRRPDAANAMRRISRRPMRNATGFVAALGVAEPQRAAGRRGREQADDRARSPGH